MFKDSLFKNKYEKEAFIKAFFIYFISIFILVTIIFYFYYRDLYFSEKYKLFLQMKNYSLSFKGKKFKIDLVKYPDNKLKLYELLETKESFYMIIPVPGVKNEFLKIYYPKSRFFEDMSSKIKTLLFFYMLSIFTVLVLSLIFAIYTVYPLKKAIIILNETLKDIVHDINTPIMSALINLKILKSKYSHDEDLERLEVAIKQMANLYENLQYILKETKKYKEDVNVKELIEKELKILSKMYPDITVRTKLEKVIISTDKRGLERIVSNLLTNAFKHNIKNGYVEIVLNKKELIIKNSSKKIENPDMIFERYYRESQRGIGIGLSIVKKLAEELNFKLKVNIKENTFIIKLKF